MLNSWVKALIVTCFDGASVMLGENGGVAAKVIEWAIHVVAMHAAAHVTQLVQGDSYKDDEYYWFFCQIVNELIVHYHRSGKKREGKNSISQAYNGEDVSNLGTLHGIRWAEAVKQVLSNGFQQVPQIVMDLNCYAKALFKSEELTVMSGSELFVDKCFIEKVDTGDGEMRDRKFGGSHERKKRPV